MLYVVRSRQATGAKGFGAIPRGFEGAACGVVMFGIGGVGDMIWHTAFGIEVDLKILFSPTHLILMSAMLMLAFGPIRSLSLSDEAPTVRNLWPAVLSTGVISSVLLVFFQYVSAFDRGIFTTKVPDLFGFGEIVRVQAIAGVVILTALFFGPLLLLARRWRLPFGSATMAFAVPALSNYIFTDFKTVRLSLALLAGGFASDLVFAAMGRVRGPRLMYRLTGALAPIAFWCTYLVITLTGNAMQWPAELWTGTIVWSGLVGTAITVLLLQPTDTPPSWLER